MNTIYTYIAFLGTTGEQKKMVLSVKKNIND